MSPLGDLELDVYLRTPQDIGAFLREQRQKAGLDQASLARRIGVSRQWIVEVEGGKPRAEIGLVLRALNALDTPLQVDLGPRYAAVADTPEVDIDYIIDQARIDPTRKPR